MPAFLAALTFFGILTLWVPAYWPVTVFQVGVFAAAAVELCRNRFCWPQFAYPAFPLFLAICVGVLQWFANWTVYPFASYVAVIQWATFTAVFLLGYSLFGDSEVRKWFRSATLWFGFLVAILATLQTFTAQGKVFWLFETGYVEDVMGPILSRNHYAAFIEIVLPIAAYEALRRAHDSVLYSGMAATMYASVIASSSRAGTVLVTLEMAAVALLMGLRRKVAFKTLSTSLLQMIVLLAAFGTVVGWQRVWDRFWAPDPMTLRREFALSSIDMIRDRPWTGIGLGTWATVYPRYAIIDNGTFANQAHNDWLQWTAEGGIPVGLGMVSLFLWCIRPAVGSVWGLGVLAVFLHALVDYPFSRPALGSWPILIIAMLAAKSSSFPAVHSTGSG